MTNEQATELLALMADQIKATDRLGETFERRFIQLNETMLNGFVRLEDKFDKKTDILADRLDTLTGRVDILTDHVDTLTDHVDTLTGRVDTLTGRVDTLTDRVDTLTDEVRDLKTEARTTNRRLQATFDQAGHLTEENTGQETRLVTLETTSADMQQRIANLEAQLRRAS